MKLVGQLVCGPGEADRYLQSTLEEFKRLCDDVIVCLCNAGPKEKAMVRKYDFRAYEDNREWGKQQPYIKTDLLRRIHKLGADWILVLDADETLPDMDRAELESLSKNRDACQFYIINLWNDENHYKRDLSFWNVRYYKADPSKGVQFLKKPVHCGNAPPYFYSLPARQTYVPHILLHKGLLERENRERKVARYRIYDPSNIHKGREYYNAISDEVQPLAISTFDQTAIKEKIINYCKKL